MAAGDLYQCGSTASLGHRIIYPKFILPEDSLIAIEKKVDSTRLIVSRNSLLQNHCLKNSKIGTELSKFGMQKQFNGIIIEDACYY
jgi:hypothetical protein